MQKVHVRNIFRLYVPLNCPEGFDILPHEDPNFGFVVTGKKQSPSYYYKLELLCLANDEHKAITLTDNWATWAKRNPIYFKNNPRTNAVEGITIRIKINNGMFDFRKLPEQLVRISLSYYSDGVFIQQGCTNVLELLPKKRQGAVDDEVSVPLVWSTNNISVDVNNTRDSPCEGEIGEDVYNLSPSGYHVGVIESDSNSSPEANLSYSPSDFDPVNFQMQHFQRAQNYGAGLPVFPVQIQPVDEQYMVLYNGNAEVVGNFRALNFYKSSDINIKEDIRLLVEDHDCRETLLKIDGVDYKFKKGIHTDTNRRFVGYIAQQVESVVPEAVQLIDGILHVDYESLIPYLSESIRANYNDINDLKSNAERIQAVVDSMYEEFVKKDRQKSSSGPSMKATPTPLAKKSVPKLWRWTIGVLSVVGVLAIVLGIIYYSTTAAEERKTPKPLAEVILSTELNGLVEFYNALNGDSWLDRGRWLNYNVSPCDWFGVQCYNGSITAITITSNNLTGTIPLALLNFSNLEILELPKNNLYGTIPNELEGLKNLRVLKLPGNNLSGTIPDNLITSFPELRALDLSCNKLTGHITPEISSNSNIMELSLSHNELSGTVPNLRGSRVMFIDAGYNKLEGEFPIVNVFTESINFENNQMSGELNMINNILPFIKVLKLGNNQFTGDLSLSDYQLLSSLKVLNISHNRFNKFRMESESSNTPVLDLCDASYIPFRCPIPNWLAARCRATCI